MSVSRGLRSVILKQRCEYVVHNDGCDSMRPIVKSCIWRRGSWPTLVQEMAWWLSGSKPIMAYCPFTNSSGIFIHENAFKYAVCKNTAIFIRPLCDSRNILFLITWSYYSCRTIHVGVKSTPLWTPIVIPFITIQRPFRDNPTIWCMHVYVPFSHDVFAFWNLNVLKD